MSRPPTSASGPVDDLGVDELSIRPARPYTGPPPLIEPMLATAGELPEADDGWAYEPRWDGFRAVVSVSAGVVRALDRHRRDLTATFPELHRLSELLAGREVTLDGEIVALDDAGLPSYDRLRARLNLDSATTIARRSKEAPTTFIAFDVLRLDGRPTITASYDQRRELLMSLGLDADCAMTSQAFTDTVGGEVYRAAVRQGIEGVVAKRRDSPYRPGERSPDWIKVKAIRTQEVVVAGWVSGQGRLSNTFGSLMMGVPSEAGLDYVGRVGAGFDGPARAELLTRLQQLASDVSPFRQVFEAREQIGVHFVRPQIVGEVRFSEWTRDGRMRHPSWRGLRPDKTVDDVHLEP